MVKGGTLGEKTMTRSERWLTVLLRVVGTAALLAIVAVFMPRDWIDRAHQALGFGPFPEAPTAEYLARTTSLFYVLAGVVQWWLSLDVRRFGTAIVALGVVMLASGMITLWIDLQAGLPPWWTMMDGPFGVALGTVYLVLQFRSRVEVVRRGAEPVGEAAPGAEPPAEVVAEAAGEVVAEAAGAPAEPPDEETEPATPAGRQPPLTDAETDTDAGSDTDVDADTDTGDDERLAPPFPPPADDA